MLNDPTVIQRLLFLVSFLASLYCYLCRVRVTRSRIAATIGPWFPPPESALQHQTTLFRSTLHRECKTQGGGGVHKAGGGGKAPSKNRLSIAGDWLAPAIVWFLVIMMGMAVVSFLLGER